MIVTKVWAMGCGRRGVGDGVWAMGCGRWGVWATGCGRRGVGDGVWVSSVYMYTARIDFGGIILTNL